MTDAVPKKGRGHRSVPRQRWVSVGERIFQFFRRPRLTPDGFAIVKVRMRVNGVPLTAADRWHFASPAQQRRIGWSDIAVMNLPVFVVATFIFMGVGGRQDHLRPVDIVFLSWFALTFVGFAWGIWVSFDTFGSIACQFYDDEDAEETPE
jgi:hypothetical protein